jgi:outer membrane protein assembly factor BamD
MRRFLSWLVVAAALAATAACSSTKSDEKLIHDLAGMDKQSMYDRGEGLYQDREYEQARQVFSFVYDTFPNDPIGHKAALRVADTFAVHRDAQSLTEARLRYKDFANRYPNDPDRDYALLMLGNTYTVRKIRPDRDLSSAREAIAAYQQLVTLYPNSKHAGEAHDRIAELRDTLAQHEMLVAEYYAKNRRWHGALWRLEYLKVNYPDYPDMERVDAMTTEMNGHIKALEAAYEKRKQASK